MCFKDTGTVTNGQEKIMDGCSKKDRQQCKNIRGSGVTSSHPFSTFSQTAGQSSSFQLRSLQWSVYLVVLILVGDLERLHGSDHCLHGCEDVLIDQFGETPFVLV